MQFIGRSTSVGQGAGGPSAVDLKALTKPSGKKWHLHSTCNLYNWGWNTMLAHACRVKLPGKFLGQNRHMFQRVSITWRNRRFKSQTARAPSSSISAFAKSSSCSKLGFPSIQWRCKRPPLASPMRAAHHSEHFWRTDQCAWIIWNHFITKWIKRWRMLSARMPTNERRICSSVSCKLQFQAA